MHGLWVKVFGSIFDHPKTVDLAAALVGLGVDPVAARDVAVGQFVRLTCWARAHRTDGRVDVLTADDFARICRFAGDADGLRTVWLRSGFVDDGSTLHEFGGLARTHARAHARSGTHAYARTHGTEERRIEENPPQAPPSGGGGVRFAQVRDLHEEWVRIREARKMPSTSFEDLDRRERKALERLLKLCKGDSELATKALRRFHALDDRWCSSRGYDLEALLARADVVVADVMPRQSVVTVAPTVEPVELAPAGTGQAIVERFLKKRKEKS